MISPSDHPESHSREAVSAVVKSGLEVRVGWRTWRGAGLWSLLVLGLVLDSQWHSSSVGVGPKDRLEGLTISTARGSLVLGCFFQTEAGRAAFPTAGVEMGTPWFDAHRERLNPSGEEAPWHGQLTMPPNLINEYQTEVSASVPLLALLPWAGLPWAWRWWRRHTAPLRGAAEGALRWLGPALACLGTVFVLLVLGLSGNNSLGLGVKAGTFGECGLVAASGSVSLQAWGKTGLGATAWEWHAWCHSPIDVSNPMPGIMEPRIYAGQKQWWHGAFRQESGPLGDYRIDLQVPLWFVLPFTWVPLAWVWWQAWRAQRLSLMRPSEA